MPARAAGSAGGPGASTSCAPRRHHYGRAPRPRIAELEPRDALPADAAACSEVGVSRTIGRNRVRQLVQEGLVLRAPRRGTFVAGSIAVRDAAEVEARRRRLADGERVVTVRRARLADDERVALEHAVFRGRATAASVDGSHGATHLRVARGTPLLGERRPTVEPHGRALALTESLYVRERPPWVSSTNEERG